MPERYRRLAVLTVAGAVILGGAGTAWAARSGSGPDYRLATAEPASVTATLAETGTLTPIHQASVAFPVSGTVASVAVTPGQHVTAGQVLGALSTAPLKASLATAQAALARASLTVSTDLSSEDTVAAAPAASASASASRLPAVPLKPLQSAVLAAQRTADSQLAAAGAALAAARQACVPSALPPGPGSVTPAPSPGGMTPGGMTPGTSAPPKSPSRPVSPWPRPTGSRPVRLPSPSPAPSSPGPARSCAAAAQQVLTAETAVLHAELALSGRLSALAAALASDVAAADTRAGGTGSGGTGSGGTGSGGTGSGGTGSGGTGAGGGPGTGTGRSAQPVSAAQLAADQSSADAAAAQVTVARQNLAAATAVSPVTGTVISVTAAPGAAAAAGTAEFVVAGLDSYEVTADVAVTDLPALKTGQSAVVQPDGSSHAITGVITAIGLAPDTTGSPVTYPITISLTGPYSGLQAGDLASVTITTSRGRGVSVPTSAVHYQGSSATVLVDSGGRARPVKITVGTKGPALTQVTRGLRAGQQVVLANLNAPLPSDNDPGANGPGPGAPGGARFVRIGR